VSLIRIMYLTLMSVVQLGRLVMSDVVMRADLTRREISCQLYQIWGYCCGLQGTQTCRNLIAASNSRMTLGSGGAFFPRISVVRSRIVAETRPNRPT
jgi:hypothetical protein